MTTEQHQPDKITPGHVKITGRIANPENDRKLRETVMQGRIERIRRLIVAFGIEFMEGYQRDRELRG